MEYEKQVEFVAPELGVRAVWEFGPYVELYAAPDVTQTPYDVLNVFDYEAGEPWGLVDVEAHIRDYFEMLEESLEE